MLDPDLVVGSVVSAFRSIPSVVSQMGDDPAAISSHSYLAGEENTLNRVVWQMRVPSILVAYTSALWGNFAGDLLWKHGVTVWYRVKNAAIGTVVPGDQVPACSAPHLFWLMMHDPVDTSFGGQANGELNIRQIRLLDSLLPLTNPSWKYVPDQPGGDLFEIEFVLPEIGDD